VSPGWFSVGRDSSKFIKLLAGALHPKDSVIWFALEIFFKNNFQSIALSLLAKRTSQQTSIF
jgi:hypothetical protein